MKLQVSATYSQTIWPWSGWIALSLTISSHAQNFEGIAQGHVNITIESEVFSSESGENTVNTTLQLPIRFAF